MGEVFKPFLVAGGDPLLLHALRPFLRHPRVGRIALALPREIADAPPPWIRALQERVIVVPGGETRTASVLAALEALPSNLDVVMVHDGARPLLTRALVDRVLGAVGNGAGAVAGTPAFDTLKEVGEEREVERTIDRTRVWQAQTPQAFPAAAFLENCRTAVREGTEATDDAAVFEAGGGRVRMVQGERWNLKVTVPEDLTVVEAILAARGIGGGGAG